MTKKIRIENADSSSFKVVVQTWDKGYPEGSPDTMASEALYSGPTDLREFYITSTRYLVVKEIPS